MMHLHLGLSALRAQQQAMTTTANNIAQAGTDGYVRQRVEFAERPAIYVDNLWQGTGVEVADVQRLIDDGVRAALQQRSSQSAGTDILREVSEQIEGLLAPGSGALAETVAQFFNAAQRLSLQPEEAGLRAEFFAQARALAAGINETLQGFQGLQASLSQQVQDRVDQTQELARQLSAVQRQLQFANGSSSPNTLLNERDRLLAELSQQIDVDSWSLLRATPPLIAAGGGLLIGDQISQWHVESMPDGRSQVIGEVGVIQPRSGALHGLLTAQDMVAEYETAFRDWAGNLVRELDHLMASGGDPALQQTSQRVVNDVDTPLAELNISYPLSAGRLYISTTILDGARQQQSINIDPATDTLRSVASKLAALDHLDVSLDAVSGRLTVRAQAGYTFDFGTGLSSTPDLGTWSGTSAATLSGDFTGENNSRWRVEVVQGGTVGLDDAVQVRVTEANTGAQINTLSLGTQVAVDGAVEIADGVVVSFSQGTLVTGETFEFDVVAQSDETGLLATLGLGTLFRGSLEGTIQLNEAAVGEWARVGAVRGIDPGAVWREMAALNRSTEPTSPSHVLDELIGQTGIDVNHYRSRSATLEQQVTDLTARRESLSGVDPNEEFVHLLEFQRGFQAASKLIVSINETLDELLAIIR